MGPPEVGSLHGPPTDLDRVVLPILQIGTTLTRIYRTSRHPAFWGRTGDHRFDAPAAEFGVLYAAIDAHGAFIETFGDTFVRTVSTASLRERSWAKIDLPRDLRLIDLSGSGLPQIGADERLCSGAHDIAQRWSLAIWQHPAAVDGLYYRARHDPSRLSVAIFDRAQSGVAVRTDGGLTDDRHRDLLAAILDVYQFALL
jgi:hypothetical protein